MEEVQPQAKAMILYNKEIEFERSIFTRDDKMTPGRCVPGGHCISLPQTGWLL